MDVSSTFYFFFSYNCDISQVSSILRLLLFLIYNCSVWYNGLTKANKTKLQTTQNKAMIIVLDLNSKVHAGPDRFKSLKW